MRAVDLIVRKRDGGALSRDEIEWVVGGYARDDIPDYQMAAFMMAVYFRGMTLEENTDLTRAMIESGETVSFPEIMRFKVDKHSTGGVGDKTTIVLAPLLASLGMVVPKLSGRGLGHTGGTIDKLESIPGFRTDISIEELQRIANEVGVAVASATHNLVPADHKMYALRDVTATVESTPLIVASIMSKKLAMLTDALVIDVKVGDGAFFPTLDDAREFAERALEVGRAFGRPVSFVLTGMEQPLGYAVGNALEVKEAIATLEGNGPKDLVEVCSSLATQLVRAQDSHRSPEEACSAVAEKLANGEALSAFERWIERQGGDASVVRDPDMLPGASRQIEVRSRRDGVVKGIRARAIGELAMRLGAGRARKEDEIDPSAGLELRKKSGSEVQRGDVLAVLHTNQEGEPHEWEEGFLSALTWSDKPYTPEPAILDVIGR